MRFAPVNLHSHFLFVDTSGTTDVHAIYPTITFGCPAAHAYGMKRGANSLHKKISLLEEKKKPSMEEQMQLDAMRLQLVQRRDLILCQVPFRFFSSFYSNI